MKITTPGQKKQVALYNQDVNLHICPLLMENNVMAIIVHINDKQALREATLFQPDWKAILDWLTKALQENFDIDSYVIDPQKNVTAVIVHKGSLPPDYTSFEAHRENVDVHFCLSGGERIFIAPVHSLKIETSYDDAHDLTSFASGPHSIINMEAGSLVVLFPQDAHLPLQPHPDHHKVKKVIVKVPIKALL